jgi:hypothetical protein
MICATMQDNTPNVAEDPQTDTTGSSDSEHLDGHMSPACRKASNANDCRDKASEES